MELNDLILEIKKDQKISTDEIISMLTEAIENEEDSVCTYKVLYKKAYGEHLTPSTCKEWVARLDVTDGSSRTNGEKWTVEQASDLGQRMGINWNYMTKNEWYAALNVFYSDFFRTANKYQIQDEAEFYADLAVDYFVNDSDGKNKTVFCYYFEHAV